MYNNRFFTSALSCRSIFVAHCSDPSFHLATQCACMQTICTSELNLICIGLIAKEVLADAESSRCGFSQDVAMGPHCYLRTEYLTRMGKSKPLNGFLRIVLIMVVRVYHINLHCIGSPHGSMSPRGPNHRAETMEFANVIRSISCFKVLFLPRSLVSLTHAHRL